MIHVLIVEDQEQNLYLLQVLLTAQGYVVTSARNGIEALEMARREAPDVIITDILMPGMDGFSLCRAWMADEGLRRVPLVFYTATYTEPADEAFALSLGAARFIVKPAEPDVFVETLRQVLADHAAQRPIPHVEPSQAADGFLQQYNAALIRKLEDKMAQLEEANRSMESDIQERKQTEQALQEREQSLALIYDTVGDIIFQLVVENDGGYRFASVNRAFLVTTGLAAEQVVGKRVDDVIPEPALTMVLGQYAQAIEQKRIMRWEETSEYPTGKLVGEVSVAPVFDLAGHCTHLIGAVHDITERKQAQEALRASEKRFRDIADNSQEWIWEVDAEGRYTYASQMAETILGYTPEETRQMHFYDLFHPEDREALKAGALAAFAARQPIHGFINRNLHKNGQTVWLATSGFPLLDDQGHLLGYRGADTDITERVRAEEALRQSEAQYRLLADHVTDMVWLMDLNLKTTYISPSVEKVRGFTLAELQQRSLSEQLAPGSLHAAMEVLSQETQKAAADPTSHLERTLELEFYRKDGTTIWLENKLSLIRDENGKAVAILGEGRDITERRQAEEERQRYTNELQTIYRSARELQRLYTPDQLARKLIHIVEETLNYEFAAVLLINEETNELVPFALSDQGRGSAFVEADKAHVSGYRIVVGKGITGLVARTGQPVRVGDVRSDPRYATVHDNIRSELCVPLRAGDRIIGVLNVESPTLDAYSDSDQRVLETVASQMALAIEQARLHLQVQLHSAELEQSVSERTAQLAAANQELEAFSYSVSHDLRAPLRALSGYSSMLLADNGDQLDEQGKHYLQRIQEASQRMGQLIEDLLDLSRLTRHDMTRQLVDLSAMAQDIVTDLRERDTQRDVEFVIAPHMIVQGDQHLLRIALENLMNNAWKFTGQRAPAQIEVGHMTVEEYRGLHADTQANLPLSDRANPQSVIYFVRDNGVGFDMAYADKLFAPFQRLHGVNEFPGTGIGLATVHRIIVRHGGRVWPEAVKGQGAMFYFTLGSAGGE